MPNTLCECPVAGFCERHKMKKGVPEHELCQGVADTPDGGLEYWNAWEQGRLGATAPADPVIDPPGFAGSRSLAGGSGTSKRQATVSKIGDRLKAIFERETGEEIPCSECKNQILQLNTMTVTQVREKRDIVVAEIADRAKRKSPKLWQRIAVTIDQALHIGETERRIGKWLDEALKEEEESVAAAQAAGGRHHRYPSQHQSRADGPPVEVVKFTEPVRRNLLYHIYPMQKNRDVWQWNLDQLIRRIDLFNGKRIVGIVHDSLADSPDMVKEYLRGHVDNFVVLNNVKKRGEGVTFLPIMEQVESFDANEITFRAHAKGVSKKTKEISVVKKWTEIMYAVCLDDWQHVRLHLESAAIVGPFRRNTRMGGASWFYSGAFYWFRNRDAFQRNWRGIHKQRVGIETWPFLMFRMEESGCLFDDKVGSLYHEDYMDDQVWPRYQEWVKKHVPNRVIAGGQISKTTTD